MRVANANGLGYMEVSWQISYVPQVAKLSDTHIAFSYSAHIHFTYGYHLTPIWHICVSHDLVTWLSYRNLMCATCHQAIWQTYCLLILGTCRFHIWVSSETDMTYMCATWLCHMRAIWETHKCYILSSNLTQIWELRMQMALAIWKSHGKFHMCHKSPSYLTHT